MAGRYRVIGVESSPYSVKLRAILRYRRLAHDWALLTRETEAWLRGRVRPLLMPVLVLPEDGRCLIDSTPIALLLEERHPGARSILPPDPAQAFLARLIEDMADEWGTKPLFFHRFERPEDQRFASRWVVSDREPGLGEPALSRAAEAFATRQLARRPLVGATAENAPVIRRSLDRVIDIFQAHLAAGHAFLFGTRPSLADFAWFGQFHTMTADPGPAALIRARGDLIHHWVRRAEDLSGLDGDWTAPEAPPAPAVTALLRLCGELYLPFLQANADAAAAGRDDVILDLPGGRYRQPVFPYQVKCLAWLRQELAGLDAAARARAAVLLRETGCWDLLAGED